jgi:hypothetical protein
MPMASRKSWAMVNVQGTPAKWMLLSKWKVKKMIVRIPTTTVQTKGPRPELPLRMMAISFLLSTLKNPQMLMTNDFNGKSSSESGTETNSTHS